MNSLLILTGLAGMAVVKVLIDLCKKPDIDDTETQNQEVNAQSEIPPKYQEIETPPNYDSI